MKANYNLAKRINPSTKEKLWYAVPASKGLMDADETAKMAVADTTLSKGEFKQVMELVGEKLMPLLLTGITITLPGFGKLRLSLSSEGVENIEDFNAQTMIKTPKLIYVPSKEIKEALQNATFELEGIVEDGVKYGSKASYYEVKGINPGGGTSTPGGGGSSDDGEL